MSKAVRDMVTRGRIFLAVERYKKGGHLSAEPLSLPESPWKDDDDPNGERSGEQGRAGGLSPGGSRVLSKVWYPLKESRAFVYSAFSRTEKR